MKKIALLTLVSFAMGIYVYTAILSYEKHKTVIVPKSSTSQTINCDNDGLANWIAERQVNLKTGKINPLAVDAAARQVALMRGVKSSLNLNWEFVGPSNIGGRTRSILIDKNNPDIIYVGGSSGGLWKSTTGGTNWKQIHYSGNTETGSTPNLFINSLCQAKNGDIYFGTGEYFANPYGSTNLIYQGAGIWKSTDGKNFDRLQSTWSSADSKATFNFVNELVAHPTEEGTIYAATMRGLRVTKNGGESWANPVKDSDGNLIEGVCKSLAINADGKSIIISIDSDVYLSNNSGVTWKKVSGTDQGLLPNNSIRTEFAFAPSDKNVVYAQATKSDKSLLNIYRSTDAGNTWVVIGPGGSSAFNVLGTSGDFSNIIAVFPDNSDKIIVGGEESLWRWSISQGWELLTMPVGGSTSSMYVHANQHDIKFHPTNPNIVFCASSGGVHRSVNGGRSWITMNKNLGITQIFRIGYDSADKLIAGSHDNGIFVIDPNRPVSGGLQNEAEAIASSDGGYCEISNIAPEIYLITLPYGSMMRSEEYGENMQNLLSVRITNKAKPGDATAKHAYITPVDFWECFNDPNSVEKVSMVAPRNYEAGEVVNVQSHIKEHYIKVVLDAPLLKGDTIEAIDHYQTRLALGLKGSLWVTTEALNFKVEPNWRPVALLKNETNDYEVVNAIKWSADGAYLYFATNRYKNSEISTILYRIGNFNEYRYDIERDAELTTYKLTVTPIAIFENRTITGIAVDPESSGNVLFTIGNYENSHYVYYSTSANVAPAVTSGSGTFVSKQGNLPQIPCYDAVILWNDSRKVIVATEMGVFSTSDITDGNPLWVDENENGPSYATVYQLRQQLLPNGWLHDLNLDSGVRNHGYIWAATYGKGIFRTKAYAGPVSVENIEVNNAVKNLTIYPNPVRDISSFKFYLNENSDVDLRIFDIQGKLIDSFSWKGLDKGSHEKQINCSELKNGVYMVKLSANNQSSTTKFIKF